MLRGTEKWVTYFVLAIVFILGVLFLARQIGVTTDLKQGLAQAKASGIMSGDLQRISGLHNASAKVFFLSFLAFCLLLIGVVIILRGVQRAYDISEVKEKVRHHLKSTTPGIVMVVLSAFLLAFSSYRIAYIETLYSSLLLDYNNYKIAVQGMKTISPGLQDPVVDTVAVSLLKNGEKKRKTGLPGIYEQNTIAPPPPEKITSKHYAETKTMPKEQRQGSTKSAAISARTKSVSLSSGSAGRKSSPDADKNKRLTEGDIRWAKHFQRKVILLGYVPPATERARYDRMRNLFEREEYQKLMDNELKWAYNFLEKTRKGYEPEPGEMYRFEDIVNRNVSANAHSRDPHKTEL